MNKPFKSEFLDRINYFYKNLDGTYTYPNSVAGDILKIGKKEIEELIERDTPKMVIKDVDIDVKLGDGWKCSVKADLCPVCKQPQHFRPDFCKCGQRLKWSE